MGIKLNHLGLLNYSETEVKVFYEELLGFNEQYRFVLSEKESFVIFGLQEKFTVLVLAKDGLKLEIFVPSNPLSFKPTVTHICLDVSDRQNLVRRCKEKGLEVVELHRSEKLTVFVKDFAGNVFELKDMKATH